MVNVTNLIESNYRSYKCNEVKATYIHEYYPESTYNTYLRYFNEALLLIKTHNENVINCKRFAVICKKFEIKSDPKEFKTLAYKKFSQLLRQEFGIKDTQVESQTIDQIDEEEKTAFIQSNVAYIGQGNNSNIVRTILRTRSWWNQAKKLSTKKGEFIWTAWLQKKVITSMTEQRVDDPTRLILYNRLDNNTCIADKKNLYFNLSAYYESIGEEVLSNIPPTFIVSNTKDSSYYNFLNYAKSQIKQGGSDTTKSDSYSDVSSII